MSLEPSFNIVKCQKWRGNPCQNMTVRTKTPVNVLFQPWLSYNVCIATPTLKVEVTVFVIHSSWPDETIPIDWMTKTRPHTLSSTWSKLQPTTISNWIPGWGHTWQQEPMAMLSEVVVSLKAVGWDSSSECKLWNIPNRAIFISALATSMITSNICTYRGSCTCTHTHTQKHADTDTWCRKCQNLKYLRQFSSYEKVKVEQWLQLGHCWERESNCSHTRSWPVAVGKHVLLCDGKKSNSKYKTHQQK